MLTCYYGSTKYLALDTETRAQTVVFRQGDKSIFASTETPQQSNGVGWAVIWYGLLMHNRWAISIHSQVSLKRES